MTFLSTSKCSSFARSSQIFPVVKWNDAFSRWNVFILSSSITCYRMYSIEWDSIWISRLLPNTPYKAYSAELKRTDPLKSWKLWIWLSPAPYDLCLANRKCSKYINLGILHNLDIIEDLSLQYYLPQNPRRRNSVRPSKERIARLNRII